MSLTSLLDPAEAEREKRRKSDALQQSLKLISEAFSLTTDDLLEILKDGILKKKLARTQRDVDAIHENGIAK